MKLKKKTYYKRKKLESAGLIFHIRSSYESEITA